MSNGSKAAGTRFETEVVKYLRHWWSEIDRRPLAGRYDRGDIKYGPPGWTIECKNHNRIDLPFFMRQAAVEARNNGDPRWLCIIKARRSKHCSGSTADCYAVMPLSIWADLVKENEELRNASPVPVQ